MNVHFLPHLPPLTRPQTPSGGPRGTVPGTHTVVCVLARSARHCAWLAPPDRWRVPRIDPGPFRAVSGRPGGVHGTPKRSRGRQSAPRNATCTPHILSQRIFNDLRDSICGFHDRQSRQKSRPGHDPAHAQMSGGTRVRTPARARHALCVYGTLSIMQYSPRHTRRCARLSRRVRGRPAAARHAHHPRELM